MTVNDVLDYVKENDVKFIRLAFCDILGTCLLYTSPSPRDA